MSDDPQHQAHPGYAFGRLELALTAAESHPDPQVRERAARKVAQWRAVLDGMATGALTIGSRTPVVDTPPWVTLEVVHGGFATGAYLAEGELLPHERELLATLPEVEGRTDRERLNRWYLGDEGRRALAAAVREGRVNVVIPEEGALPVVAWLLDHGLDAEALDLVAALHPLVPRLRFYPELRAVPRPSGATVRLCTVGEATAALHAVRPQAQVEAMNATLRVWDPLYDRLVELWASTVDGDVPAARFPADWSERRAAWLADDAAAARGYGRTGRHASAKGNYQWLRAALEATPGADRPPSARDLGRVRAALAATTARRGEPGSDRRRAARAVQATSAARPSKLDLAAIVIRRLAALPAESGLPGPEVVTPPVREGESPVVAAGTELPEGLRHKALRALEAPIEELVARGVIGSAEVLAIVLPQITAQVAAASIADPGLRALYQQVYAAFRRRRSLLLLNLEHQVRLDELPWVAALAPLRRRELDDGTRARQTLEQVTLLAFASFPHTILPNPLVREMGALAQRAGLRLPLVEEVAADIFMGTFTLKWAEAALVAAEQLEGSLYARYYDLPSPAVAAGWTKETKTRWGTATAEGFFAECKRRAKEAKEAKGSHVARNGAIIEQSMVLTTQDLAALTRGLGLEDTVRGLAPELVDACFRFVVRRQQQVAPRFKARLQMVKNTAYAWRQGLYFLSFLDGPAQLRACEALETLVLEGPSDWIGRFEPVLEGLRHVVEGGRFDDDGAATRDGRPARRFLGWSVGPHWLLEPAGPRATS